jgi:hypothetical protein
VRCRQKQRQVHCLWQSSVQYARNGGEHTGAAGARLHPPLREEAVSVHLSGGAGACLLPPLREEAVSVHLSGVCSLLCCQRQRTYRPEQTSAAGALYHVGEVLQHGRARMHVDTISHRLRLWKYTSNLS